MSDSSRPGCAACSSSDCTDPELRQQSRERAHRLLRREHRGPQGAPTRRPHQRAARRRGRRRAGADPHILGTLGLLLIAGIDTTWSSIGSSLWHLATHPDDRARLAAEPELIPTAVEELLRAYSPVTMARIVNEETEVNGACMHAGDRMSDELPGREPRPERVRRRRPGAHRPRGQPRTSRSASASTAAPARTSRAWRCASRIEEWLARIPEFSRRRRRGVTWAGGQVRGPRSMPVVFGGCREGARRSTRSARGTAGATRSRRSCSSRTTTATRS